MNKISVIGWAFLAGAALGSHPSAARAQIPGESAYNMRRSLRDEYRAIVYEEVRQAMVEWTEQVNGRNIDQLKKGVTENVLFAPLGWSVVGQAQFADSMKNWLPRVGGYHFIMADFDASGNLAYAYGTVRYHLAGGSTSTGGTETSGEAVIVLYRSGSRWKVRSYLERQPSP